MRTTRIFALLALFTVVLAIALPRPAQADTDNVEILSGVVVVDRDGVVLVLLDQDAGEVEPVNGAGLLNAGQIAPGDVVDVKITHDNGKKHKHRGHVTILK
ncbi:MAG: hypothetical protein KDA42_08225 [Planctomycetales bacterium]|nr:hypothetical protein [Planctomycetales bacterium]